MKTSEIIRQAIADYYKEKGEPVPNWKPQRNDQWFDEYCKELDERRGR